MCIRDRRGGVRARQLALCALCARKARGAQRVYSEPVVGIAAVRGGVGLQDVYKRQDNDGVTDYTPAPAPAPTPAPAPAPTPAPAPAPVYNDSGYSDYGGSDYGGSDYDD